MQQQNPACRAHRLPPPGLRRGTRDLRRIAGIRLQGATTASQQIPVLLGFVAMSSAIDLFRIWRAARHDAKKYLKMKHLARALFNAAFNLKLNLVFKQLINVCCIGGVDACYERLKSIQTDPHFGRSRIVKRAFDTKAEDRKWHFRIIHSLGIQRSRRIVV